MLTHLSIEAVPDGVVDTPSGIDTDAAEALLLAAGRARWVKGIADVRESVQPLREALKPSAGQDVWESTERVAPHYDWYKNRTLGAVGSADWIGISEGKTFLLQVSPGTVGLTAVDRNRAEKAETRRRAAQAGQVDQAAAEISRAVPVGPHLPLEEMEADFRAYGKAQVDFETGEIYDEPRDAQVRKVIVEWSKKSRMSLVKAVAQLDYSDWTDADGDLAMVTVTYPGDWLSVAPDGKTAKRHLDLLRRRFENTGNRWRVLWKQEFQGRGAPHFHILMRVPATVQGDGGYERFPFPAKPYKVVEAFEPWLSRTWADIVGADKDSGEYDRHVQAGTRVDFSGKKFSDPRRIALYFLGHSIKSVDGKEYQHIVPEAWQGPGKGPGRFWGSYGFKKALVEVEVSMADFHQLARELRKLQRARDWKTSLTRRYGIAKGLGVNNPRDVVRSAKHGVYKKKTRALGASGSLRGGWVLLNDALPVVEMLGVLLQRSPEHPRSNRGAASFESGFRVPTHSA